MPTARRSPVIRRCAIACASAFAAHNANAPGGSTRVARAMLLADAPDQAAGEVTDKGSINQQCALALRASTAIAVLLGAAPHPDG